MTTHFVTYATHDERYYKLLKQSAVEHNIKLVTLGIGEKWNGLQDKLIGVYKFLKNLPENDIVCFIDAFDTVIFANEEEIVNKFLKSGKKLIFSKGGNTKGVGTYIQKKLFPPCHDEQLNSGMYIGYVKTIKKVLTDILKNEGKFDDQTEVSKMCSNPNYNIVIDKNCDIFYNFSTHDTIEIKEKRLIYNKSYPCFISGPLCKDMSNIFKELGLKDIPHIKCNYKNRFQEYFNMFLPEIVFLFFIILLLKFYPTKHKLLLITTSISVFIHYMTHMKYLKYRFMHTIMDFIHIYVILYIIVYPITILMNKNKNISGYNLFILIFIVQAILFNGCIINKTHERLDKNFNFIGVPGRLKFNLEQNKDKGFHAWLMAQTTLFTYILIINFIVFMRNK